MKHIALSLVLLTSLLLTTLTGAEIFEQGYKTYNGPEYVPGQILVKFHPWAKLADIEKLNRGNGVAIERVGPISGVMRLKIPAEKAVEQMVRVYEKHPLVKYAHANYICHASSIPNDSLYPYQWHFPMINMESAWDIEPGGDPGIVVAVLDTGIAYEDHENYAMAPDLSETNFVAGYDFINNDEHANDDEGHGTHVAGTIAQTTNNNDGVAGIAYKTSIMPVKVLGANGSGTTDSLIDGIYYAANNGAHVINMSLSFYWWYTPIAALGEAVANAYNQGCVLVAASGNSGVNRVSYPAAYPEVIAVGAVHSGDARANYSQYGQELELVAPGGDGTDRDGNGYMDGVLQQTFAPGQPTVFGFYFYTGTSMAAPHVSGLVGLLLSQNPSRTPVEIRNILHNTSVDLGSPGWDLYYGYGRIDAFAALSLSTPNNTPPAANNDNANTSEDTSIDIAVLANDTDADNDPLTVTNLTQPSNGTTALNADNTITYTPSVNYNGTDSFTYTANDGKADSNTATVTVDVQPVNDIPVALNDSVSTQEDTPVNIGVLSNDTDADNDLLTVTNLTQPSNGTATLNADNTITYTPSANYSGIDSFTYTANDGIADSNAATVTITVNSSTPTAYVNIDMEKQSHTKKAWWEASATVRITSDDAGTNPIVGSEISGQWSGAYKRSVSGISDADGVCVFETGWIKEPGTVTFTVNKVMKDGQDYLLDGEISGSIGVPESAAAAILAQNYPNPFNPETWIPFTLFEAEYVAIRICDSAGHIVRILNLGHRTPGVYMTKDKAAYWDGKNEIGEQAASGVYFYTIQAGEFTATKKMVIAE